MPVEPPPSRWEFPDPAGADEDGVVGTGADLEPGTLLAAYRAGLFPMRLGGLDGPLGWWSPDPRGVIPLDGFHVSRSLRRAKRRYTATVDTAFDEVIRGCADRQRERGWIGADFVAAYTRLHEMGWVHSVETWRGERLAGGLYGVRIGGFFAGESMFHRLTDGGKVALWAAVELLRLDGATLFDVQWATRHLQTLGAVDVPRGAYLERLAEAVASTSSGRAPTSRPAPGDR